MYMLYNAANILYPANTSYMAFYLSFNSRILAFTLV